MEWQPIETAPTDGTAIQTVNGNVITGLGRAWATSGDNSMHGVSPEYTSVQYAYFN